jgi:hypothetical protein
MGLNSLWSEGFWKVPGKPDPYHSLAAQFFCFCIFSWLAHNIKHAVCFFFLFMSKKISTFGGLGQTRGQAHKFVPETSRAVSEKSVKSAPPVFLLARN